MTAPAARKEPSLYNFAPGRVLARKYEVLSRVGASSSGELYMLSEQATGIERTAKFFSPELDPKNRCANTSAVKMHKLRHCDILVHYRTQETISVDGRDVTFLVSDFFQGETLTAFLARAPQGRLGAFEGLHLLHAMALGVEQIHRLGEAHGELAMEHIMVRRKGLRFQVKLLDLNPEFAANRDSIRDDVYDLIHILHQALGGGKTYASLPAPVKALCCGMRRASIHERFRNAGELRIYLETMTWS